MFAIDVPGREFVLKSADMGSLDVGSPIFFRRLQVGQIISYQLDPDGKGVTMRVFVNAPYDKYVKPRHALLAGERDRRVARYDGRQGQHRIAGGDPDRRTRIPDARRYGR